MDTLRFDLTHRAGGFKPMNAVNNGPIYRRFEPDQKKENLADFTAAGIPYVRNHDAAFESRYGGEHSVDITAIFPDFDADPTLPASYDFACTDEYLQIIELSGAKVFYRLGQKIEHIIKKYGSLPPRDFKKWAVICEHIIRHYTEGWADGFHMDIAYWEIWNEPDHDPDDGKNKRTWGGTRRQFFDFFEVAAKHLKACFPHLKIGGPAVGGNEEWANDFLTEMQARKVPLDFFSWHIYCSDPREMVGKAERYKKMLNAHGYGDAESILDEWNYVRGWLDEFVYSIEVIIGMKGAAFTMACMTAAQQSSIDMLMYYDARPTCFNGLFDFYTLRPMKGYYPFRWFSSFYGMQEVRSEDRAENIYTLCGVGDDGRAQLALTYYTDDDAAGAREVRLDLGRAGTYEVYLLDGEHNATLVGTTEDLTFTMEANTCLLLREV